MLQLVTSWTVDRLWRGGGLAVDQGVDRAVGLVDRHVDRRGVSWGWWVLLAVANKVWFVTHGLLCSVHSVLLFRSTLGGIIFTFSTLSMV